MSQLNVSTTLADPKTCPEVLNLCDAAVQDCKKQVKIRDLRIKEQGDYMKGLEKRVADSNSTLRSPMFWGVVGVIVGVGVGLKLGR